MKIYTTNYFDTFITAADDTKVSKGTQPPTKDKRTVADIQYELIARNPYKFTSDDILFQTYATKNDLLPEEYESARKQFFSKGQACLRASPLTKTYGFGIHSNEEGKIALFGMETNEYQKFLTDQKVQKVKAMKSKR